MSTGTVYKFEVKSLSGEWLQVGPNYSWWFPFLFRSSAEEAEEHYRKLGLETRLQEDEMEFDDR